MTSAAMVMERFRSCSANRPMRRGRNVSAAARGRWSDARTSWYRRNRGGADSDMRLNRSARRLAVSPSRPAGRARAMVANFRSRARSQGRTPAPSRPLRRRPMVRVARVVGRDHRPFAAANDERPAAVGLQVVIVTAERVGLVDAGSVGVPPFVPVVVLQPLVRVQPSRVHSGACHRNATRCATVGDRPRCVMFATSTPLVITILRIASPSRARAVATGMGPRPVISHVSPSATAPRSSAA